MGVGADLLVEGVVEIVAKMIVKVMADAAAQIEIPGLNGMLGWGIKCVRVRGGLAVV